jgi:uncharacterized membrane protein YeiH
MRLALSRNRSRAPPSRPATLLLHSVYQLAMVAEAMSGALLGMRRGSDRLGPCLIGAVTARGDATVRDELLGSLSACMDLAYRLRSHYN